MSIDKEMSLQASKMAEATRALPPELAQDPGLWPSNWIQILVSHLLDQDLEPLRHQSTRRDGGEADDLSIIGNYLGFDSRFDDALELSFYVDQSIYRYTHVSLLPRRLPVYTPEGLRLIWSISRRLKRDLRWKQASCGARRERIDIKDIERFEQTRQSELMAF